MRSRWAIQSTPGLKPRSICRRWVSGWRPANRAVFPRSPPPQARRDAPPRGEPGGGAPEPGGIRTGDASPQATAGACVACAALHPAPLLAFHEHALGSSFAILTADRGAPLKRSSETRRVTPIKTEGYTFSEEARLWEVFHLEGEWMVIRQTLGETLGVAQETEAGLVHRADCPFSGAITVAGRRCVAGGGESATALDLATNPPVELGTTAAVGGDDLGRWRQRADGLPGDRCLADPPAVRLRAALAHRGTRGGNVSANGSTDLKSGQCLPPLSTANALRLRTGRPAAWPPPGDDPPKPCSGRTRSRCPPA